MVLSYPQVSGDLNQTNGNENGFAVRATFWDTVYLVNIGVASTIGSTQGPKASGRATQLANTGGMVKVNYNIGKNDLCPRTPTHLSVDATVQAQGD